MTETSPASSIPSPSIIGDLNPVDSTPMAAELPTLHQSYRLDGRNYLQWAQLVKTLLKGRSKGSHLTADPPKEEDPSFIAWDVEDSRILSWLWSTMQPDISRNYMFLNTAKEVWETVQQTFSKVRDASVIFEVKTKINSTKQGPLTVTEYYNQMRGLMAGTRSVSSN